MPDTKIAVISVGPKDVVLAPAYYREYFEVLAKGREWEMQFHVETDMAGKIISTHYDVWVGDSVMASGTDPAMLRHCGNRDAAAIARGAGFRYDEGGFYPSMLTESRDSSSWQAQPDDVAWRLSLTEEQVHRVWTAPNAERAELARKLDPEVSLRWEKIVDEANERALKL